MKRFRGVPSVVAIWRAVFSCAVVALAGCSYMQPYVKKDVTGDVAAGSDPMPLTRQAMSRLDKWVVEVDKGHASASNWRRGMNLLTFGLVSATGVSALRSNPSTNTTRNLALGSGVAYTGTSLFLPTGQTDLYNGANTALICIQGRVSGLHSSIASQSAQLAADLPQQYKDAVYTQNSCAIDAATQAHVDAAETARQAAIAAVAQARGADPAVATKAENAGLNVVHTLNTQLDALSPSLEAILAAAKSAVGIANGLAPAPAARAAPAATQKPQQPQAAPACNQVPQAEVDKLRVRLLALQASYEGFQSSIGQQLNAVAALDTACTLAPLQLAPVALNTGEITLIKEGKQVVEISGGTGMYFWNPIGAFPDTIDVSIFGKTMVVIAKSTLAPGPTYTISVRDSSAAPRPVQLKLITK